MNIAQIKQLEAVDGWIDFSGEIIEIKETKSRTKKNRLMQKVKLKDETGEIGAWIYADDHQHQPHESITANGMLKEYEDHRYIDYATVKQSQQSPPQNAQQPPQQATQRPNSTKPDQEVRHGLVCAYIEAGKEPTITDINYWTEFIVTGKAPLPPGKQDSERQGDDIPDY